MPRWTLENLIDFEQALAADPKTSALTKAAVSQAANGLDGADARRAGLLVWLEAVRQERPAGGLFAVGLRGIRALMIVSGWGIGAGLVQSLLNRDIGGLNVVVFLAISIGVQWLILLAASIGWIFRRKVAGNFTLFEMLLVAAVRRMVRLEKDGWWQRLMDGGTASRAAFGWRIGALAQVFGVWFNLGIITALGAFVLTKNVGFYWETTTLGAMRGALETTVEILSFPWAFVWPSAVPDAAVIDSTRLLPGQAGRLNPGPEAWWLFLLAATFVWGLLPRLMLWLLAHHASGRALGKLDFQARHHRVLWRELTGTTRAEVDEKPLDGVLVLDVGGSGLKPESLRPFLLQKLRVHPAAWHSVAVLDPGAEQQAAEAIALAPAGVVLLAEGWALSPPRMKALHSQIRAVAGAVAPVKFLVANEVEDAPAAPTADEKAEWEKFVDSLRDPNAEVFCFGG